MPMQRAIPTTDRRLLDMTMLLKSQRFGMLCCHYLEVPSTLTNHLSTSAISLPAKLSHRLTIIQRNSTFSRRSSQRTEPNLPPISSLLRQHSLLLQIQKMLEGRSEERRV